LDPFHLRRGDAPLIISMPHVGTHLPADLADSMTPMARRVPDTDWHTDRLYGFAAAGKDFAAAGEGFAAAGEATVIAATHSRYVIDLNRAPDNRSLYPGADNTELCPLTTFDHEPIYLPGQEPDGTETARRIESFWQPYHDAIASEIARLCGRHGRILLWDAHSIRSEVARFFAGRLPDFNLGTGDGTTADAELAGRVVASAEAENGYTTACNGRFKGGHITRHFGRPDKGVHAIQLELSQATYMEEKPPFRFLPTQAARVSGAIERMIRAGLGWIAEG